MSHDGDVDLVRGRVIGWVCFRRCHDASGEPQARLCERMKTSGSGIPDVPATARTLNQRLHGDRLRECFEGSVTGRVSGRIDARPPGVRVDQPRVGVTVQTHQQRASVLIDHESLSWGWARLARPDEDDLRLRSLHYRSTRAAARSQRQDEEQGEASDHPLSIGV